MVGDEIYFSPCDFEQVGKPIKYDFRKFTFFVKKRTLRLDSYRSGVWFIELECKGIEKFIEPKPKK